jgi:hypothetical protein
MVVAQVKTHRLLEWSATAGTSTFFCPDAIVWSHESLTHARSADAARDVTWERRDMRDLPWPARFDGAFGLGNSFGYLDDEGNQAFLHAVAAALKPGARFLLKTPMVLENLLGWIQERPWWNVGDMRLDIEYTHISNGHVDTRYGSHRAYTYRQLVELLEGWASPSGPPNRGRSRRTTCRSSRYASNAARGRPASFRRQVADGIDKLQILTLCTWWRRDSLPRQLVGSVPSKAFRRCELQPPP